MTQTRIAVCVAALVCVWSLPFARGDDAAKNAEPNVNDAAEKSPEKEHDSAVGRQAFQALVERLEKLERELQRLKASGELPERIPSDKQEQRVVTMLETAHIGLAYYGAPNGTRFFVGRLLFVNLTDHDVAISREQIQLLVDGKPFGIKDLPTQLQYQSFQVGTQTLQFRSLQPAKQLKLRPGRSGSTWVVFVDLPNGNQIPKMTLRTTLDGRDEPLDVNAVCRDQLDLAVERIGPRECLALLTISGTLNAINAGFLVEQLDQLAAQKVARVVMCWSDSADPLDSQLFNWLQQVAASAGRGEVTNPQFPIVPASIRELHLAEVPNQSSSSRARTLYASPATNLVRVHATTAAAVSAALRTAYEVLPRGELLNAVQQGHPSTRAAALAAGGGRLSNAELPIILNLADDGDPDIQNAALIALRHFGEVPAIEKLLQYARKNVEPLSSTAIESLAASRYDAAHAALLNLIRNEGSTSKKTIVEILSHNPRPIWSETIYAFVTEADSDLGVEGLQALVRVGHPKLFDVLKDNLQKGNSPMQQAAFDVLINRTDADSEALAMEHTLKYLDKSPPTPSMYTLLQRTKDARAVPKLLKHLKRSDDNRSNLISTLAQIGDDSIADDLVKLYPQLRNYERSTVLNALHQLHSPRFQELAAKALESSDRSEIAAACQGLQADGSPAAVKLLIDAFEQASDSSILSFVCNALGAVGTPDARAVLKKARASDDANRRTQAHNALRSIYQRSPAMQYVSQGSDAHRQGDFKTAKSHFNLAIQVDAELPPAYVGRGNALLRLNEVAAARKDFEKAVELDELDSLAVTGLAVALVLSGDQERGVEMIETRRDKFKTDQLFAYNAACVYGRVLEQLEKRDKTDERDQQLQQAQKKALSELEQAVKLGFKDFDWMKEDPDLKLLRELPEFKKLLSPMTGNQ